MNARCVHVLTRGKNKGQPCSRPAQTGCARCRLHIAHEPVPDGHAMGMDSLPHDVLAKIAQLAMNNPVKNVKLPFVLEATCKAFQEVVCKQGVYEAICRERHIPLPSGSDHVAAKTAIRLYNEVGCQLCGKARVRKVYGEFGVRCCTDCLRRNTINEYYLTQMGLSRNMLAGARRHVVDMYNPYSRGSKYYDATYFWRGDVDAVCRERFGCSLDDMPRQFVQRNLSNLETHLAGIRVKDVTVDCVRLHTDFDTRSKISMLADIDLADLVKQTRRAKRAVEIHSVWSQCDAGFAMVFRSMRGMIEGHAVYNQLMRSKKRVPTAEDWQAVRGDLPVYCESARRDPTGSNEQKMKCPHCPQTSARLFSPFGLRDHCRARHPDAE